MKVYHKNLAFLADKCFNYSMQQTADHMHVKSNLHSL